MKKVLVTGANGFIGTALIKEMEKNGNEIIAVIRSPDESIREIQNIKNIRIVYCELSEISKLETLISDRDIDTCIHLAWADSTGDGRACYKKQLENVQYALDVVNVASKIGIKRYVGAGTLAEKDVLNYHSKDGATPNPVSMYGIAKITTHFMSKTECTRVGMEHIWCYLSNTYGIGNRTQNFINFACKLMIKGERAAFTSGEQMYDFVYITDTARALYAAAEKGKKNTAYYLGSTKQRKLKEYIKIMRDAIDPSLELHLGEVPFHGTPLADEAFDADKLVRDTGYVPSIDFEEGIKQTVEWLKNGM